MSVVFVVTALGCWSRRGIGAAPGPDKIRASHLSHGLALRKSDWQKVPMWMTRQAVLEFAGREVVITNPDKPFFPQAGHTKLHLVRYYAAVAEGALRGIAGRPIVVKRYVDAPRVSRSSRSGPPSSAPSGSRRWSCAFRRGGRRERLSCATRRSFCGW